MNRWKKYGGIGAGIVAVGLGLSALVCNSCSKKNNNTVSTSDFNYDNPGELPMGEPLYGGKLENKDRSLVWYLDVNFEAAESDSFLERVAKRIRQSGSEFCDEGIYDHFISRPDGLKGKIQNWYIDFLSKKEDELISKPGANEDEIREADFYISFEEKNGERRIRDYLSKFNTPNADFQTTFRKLKKDLMDQKRMELVDQQSPKSTGREKRK